MASDYGTVGRFKLEGTDKLKKKLAKLGNAVELRVLASAAGFAMTPVASAARREVTKGTKPHKTYRGRTVVGGFLKRNIRKKTHKWKNKKGVVAMVGPVKEAFYGEFLEYGKNQKHRQTPKPWLEPAFESQKDKVLSRFQSRMADKIKAAAR